MGTTRNIGQILVEKAQELDPSYIPNKFNDMGEALDIILSKNSGSTSTRLPLAYHPGAIPQFGDTINDYYFDPIHYSTPKLLKNFILHMPWDLKIPSSSWENYCNDTNVLALQVQWFADLTVELYVFKDNFDDFLLTFSFDMYYVEYISSERALHWIQNAPGREETSAMSQVGWNMQPDDTCDNLPITEADYSKFPMHISLEDDPILLDNKISYRSQDISPLSLLFSYNEPFDPYQQHTRILNFLKDFDCDIITK